MPGNQQHTDGYADRSVTPIKLSGEPNGWTFGISGSAVLISLFGELELTGTATRHIDEKGNLITAKLTSPGSKIQQDDVEGAYFYKDSCTPADYLWINVQLNHDRKLGAELSPHLHWWQQSATIPNWVIQYRYQKLGSIKTTTWTNIRWVSHAYVWVTGTINQVTDFMDITPPSGDGLSDAIQIRLIRDTGNSLGLFSGTDAVVGDRYVTDLDIHKEIDSMGSKQEYLK